MLSVFLAGFVLGAFALAVVFVVAVNFNQTKAQ
jgi:hypothetical protein